MAERCKEEYRGKRRELDDSNRRDVVGGEKTTERLMFQADPEQRPIPVPKDDEVLIEIDCVGICGSDIHMVAHGPTGDCPPVILGHEASGTVACVGRCVTKLKRGDRVAIEPAVPCRMCQFCSLGCYDLCCTMTLYGCGPKPGSLARYYAHPADYCHLLPDHLTMEEGAMIEPLAIAVHANRRAGVTCGSKVLICGAGTMGLLCLLAAKAMGACQVVVIDHIEHRLNVARCIGADFTVLVAEGCHCDKNIANTIHCLLHCEPPIAIECWGTEMGARIAILATRAGGCVVFVGMSSPCVRIPLTEACCKEIDLRGISRYANDFACALAYVCARQINVAQLITHRFTLEQTHVAFQTARDGCGNPIKVMIYCKRNWCCCT
ncbi:sorbitol dehydrogenase [Anabrus simplex]|uniref:sorbitol dehydrogenase n=1 Tax=Anabrus simplex TaxID=316456 RepID=UPI0034DD17F9